MKFSHLIHFRLFQMDRQSSDNRVHHLHRHLAPISVGALMLLSFLVTGVAQGDVGPRTTSAMATINLGMLNGPAGFRIEGRNAGDQAGRSLRNAGDVNGDGLDDFIIGAPSASPDGIQSAGEAYVVFGRTTNPTSLPLSNLNGSAGFRLVGVTFNDEAGQAVSGAGDVNGDGFDDLIVGAPGADPDDNLPEAGAAFVVFGRPQFPAQIKLAMLNGTTGFRINGIAADDRAGASVSHAGDVNGDGYDDILLGAPDASPGGKPRIGQAYIVLGQPSFTSRFELSSLNGTNGFVINGVAAESSAGKVVNAAGDMNKDGYGDVMLAAGNFLTGRSLETGTLFVIFGSKLMPSKFNLSGINGVNGFRIEGIEDGDNAGRAAAPAGDVNGDGRQDLVLGAPFAAAHKGEAYVVFGQASYPTTVNLKDLNGSNGFRLSGSEANGEAGTAVGASDVNGDGLEDVIVGASAAGSGSSRFAGMTYVVFGRTGFEPIISLGALGNGGIRFDGAAAGHQAGQTISAAGDLNGDGYDEFLIGAPNAGPGIKDDTGYAYLVQGGPTLGVPMPVTHPGSPIDDNLTGTTGNDVMIANRGNDSVSAAAGIDALKGGSGNDRLDGGPGGDRIIGGNGNDIASYAGSGSAVNVDLFTGVTSGGDAAGDHLRSIEGVIGSPTADSLAGDSLDNLMDGGGGDDNLSGGRGNDAFRYRPGSGDDVISDFAPGSESDDYLDFSSYPAIMGVGELNIQTQGADTRIILPGGESILLKNVAAAALHVDDYRFAGVPLAVPDAFSTPINVQLKVNAPGVLANDDNPTVNALSAILIDAPLYGSLTLQSGGGFTYTPNQDFVGVDEFTYRADNGQKSNVARVTIDVTIMPPTAVDDVYLIELGDTLTVPTPGVLGNDQSPGQRPLAATLLEEPTDGELNFSADGSFSYTPTVDYSTQDRFTYQASNGLVSNTATVIINIIDPDGPPVASDDSYKLQVGEVLTVSAPGVLGNDINPLGGAMTAKPGVNPRHGQLSLNTNGAFTYTPNAGYVGTDSFTYQADNGQPSNMATVNLTISDTPSDGETIMLPVVLGR